MIRLNASCRAPNRIAAGRTLTEVAACVSCFVAAASLLMPALASSRDGGKSARCLANLGRLGAATAVYAAADPSELAVPAHSLFGRVPGALGECEWGGKSGAGEPQTGSDGLFSKWGTAEGRGPATRPLNRVLYGDVFPDHADDPGADYVNWHRDSQLDLSVYRCPADFGYSGYHFSSFKNSRLPSFATMATATPPCPLGSAFPGAAAGCRPTPRS